MCKVHCLILFSFMKFVFSYMFSFMGMSSFFGLFDFEMYLCYMDSNVKTHKSCQIHIRLTMIQRLIELFNFTITISKGFRTITIGSFYVCKA